MEGHCCPAAGCKWGAGDKPRPHFSSVWLCYALDGQLDASGARSTRAVVSCGQEGQGQAEVMTPGPPSLWVSPRQQEACTSASVGASRAFSPFPGWTVSEGSVTRASHRPWAAPCGRVCWALWETVGTAAHRDASVTG